ncbi:Hypothetical predicted protein, partial [Paramuricea clavata]
MAEKSLRDIEVSFINEHFDGVSFENDCCSVFFDGNDEELEAILRKFLAINSTSFVTVENHSKDKKKKRFTQAALVGENASEIRRSTRFYLKIPLSCAHQRHPVGAASTIGQYVDSHVVKKIYDLVEQNISNVTEVKRWLDHFVENELFRDVPKTQLPRKTNRRYYPSRQDLRNHIGRAISAFKYCDDDQESLARKIEEWKAKDPTSNFFYRMTDETTERNNDRKRRPGEKTFLFVHQESWQRRLLK